MTEADITPLDARNLGPLSGVRVLDLSRLAPGPYCSMLLGDLGADVIRIDAPTPPARTYTMLARNKRSLVLDLKTAAGRVVLHRLVRTADVVLEGNRPGVMARLEADWRTLSALNPRLIYCSLTGFGQKGPLALAAGHDINYIALSGVLSQMGNQATGPLAPLNLVADYGGGGMLAAFGITSALFERERSGRGQFIDVAMIDGAASLMAAHYSTGGELSRPGVGLLGGGAPFYRCYRTHDDGWMAVGAIEPKFFDGLCHGTGLRFKDRQMDRDSWPEQHRAFERAFAERSRRHWTEVFSEIDACVSPVLDLDEAPEHPHNVDRAAFLVGPDDQLHVAPAPRFSRTPATIRRAAPLPGAHQLEILQAAGLSPSAIDEMEAQGAFGPRAETTKQASDPVIDDQPVTVEEGVSRHEQ